MTTERFCTKCGRKFIATGREVICPACKAAAAEDAKRAAVLKAKRASWTGESVPVRISGKASTVIRRYGAAHNLPFAEALDELLKSTPFFQTAGKAWEDITPYRSRRRDKHATETTQDETDKQAASKPQEVKQDAPQEVQAAKTTNKTSTAKKAIKTTSKASTSKASTSKASASKK